MKKIKLCALLTAALMALTMLFAACGGQSSSSSSSSSTASSTSSSTASSDSASDSNSDAEQSDAVEDWMKPFDETVKLNVVVGWDADSGVKEGTTPETNALVQVAKDMLNIELNFLWMVPNDQLSDRLALQIGSGEIPDILMLSSGDFYEFMDSDYLRDLTSAYETYACDELRYTVEAFGEAPIQYSSRDGKLLGIPALLDTAESVCGLYYRSDWLEALNMSVPTNADEVNNMLIEFAKYGSTVNGGKDTAGIGTTSSVLNTNFAFNGYFQMYGAYPNKWIMRDGQLTNGIIMDEMIDALNGLKTLYDNGAIAPDFATWNSDQFVERVASSQVGAAFGTYYIPAWPLNESKNMTPESEWSEINLSSLGGKSNPSISQVSVQHFNVVTKDAPAQAEEALIKLLNLSLVTNANSTFDKAVFNGQDLAENGASIFYLPVYMYYPTPWTDYRNRIWDAYDKQDPSGLLTDVEREWYGYMCDWLENGNESENLATAWGMYKSRLTEDMGIGVGLSVQKSGKAEESYFYGPATPTEQRTSSTLTDMAVSFVIEYIMGQKTEADWESFKQSWYDMGGQAWTKEVNEQYTNITQ